tara:strand:+ start:950 stop:1513 length:564 start_codon:yes stop_codon:yes gene_type:complete
MIRNIVEKTAALFLLISFLPLIVTISLLIKLTSEGPIIYWSERVGKDDRIFFMPKFRTMHIKTPQVATHLLEDPDRHTTLIGKILRKYSLDELIQLFSIVLGDMCFIGPRPALFNQYDLIELRRKEGLNTLKPGITGWAQVNGRDEISIQEKVTLDNEYFKKKSVSFDLYILWLTLKKIMTKEGISH